MTNPCITGDHFGIEGLKSSLLRIGKKHAFSDGRTPLDSLISKDEEVARIAEKCKAGSYKFTPYSLKLFLKGKGEPPREICVPNLVDQAVLKSLDLSLKQHCAITNATDLAYFVIQKVCKDIISMPPATMVLRLDIKKYFDSINHEKLLNRIKEKSCPLFMKDLVERAIKTPSKEFHEKTPSLRERGVPQGLSIASHLADLYLESFENVLKKYSAGSYRYVDDILVFFFPEQEAELFSFIEENFDALGLEFHKEKSKKYYKGQLYSKEGFDFLGYQFQVSKNSLKISVRKSSVQKFLNSTIALITKYQKGGYHSKYADTREAEEAFVFDLNEKITGAFKDDKRYGWLWYFRQMDDLALLDMMDKIIKRELQKDITTRGLKIKRLKRAFYEIKNFTSGNRYILNYGMKDVALIKRYFGRFDKRIGFSKTDDATLAAFQFWASNRLKRLMLDEVRAS